MFIEIYDKSLVEVGGTRYFMTKGDKHLGIVGDTSGFQGQSDANGTLLCPLSSENAAMLRGHLPWLQPVALDTHTSAGFGDRLGVATPGHVLAVEENTIAPIFAQQSVRENARTGRTPQEVVDDAMWGVFQAGWRQPWGADADHLKHPEDIPDFVEAGYTFFTVDPGDHVDDEAQSADKTTLVEKVKSLPWDIMASSPQDLYQRLLNNSVELNQFSLTFDEITLLRAAAKYGRAVAHAVSMYHHLVSLMQGRTFDFEVSVDETATTTSIHEHFYIANELQRLGVKWVSLAPRFVGRFEKGVDYIGSLTELDTNLTEHVAVMRHFGEYKISLHSGSDKFSVYPLATKHAKGLLHLKTAGTSYLEALRVLATTEKPFFREILDFSRHRYETDRATYHVSAQLAKVPAAKTVTEEALPDLLNQFDARQVLHVTYGAVLDHYGKQLHQSLVLHEEEYYATLEQHFRRHLEPLKEKIYV